MRHTCPLVCHDVCYYYYCAFFSFWPLKLLLWLGAFVGMFFIPSENLAHFWLAAVIISVLYIVLQSLFFVNFAHDVAEYWVGLYEETENGFYQFLLIGTTLLLNGAALTGTILFYIHYTHTLDVVFTSVNLALAIIQTGLAILPSVQAANPRSGILQPSFVNFYNTYLVGSAILSHHNIKVHSSLGDWALYVGLLLTFLSIVYAAYTTGSSGRKLLLKSAESDDKLGGESGEDSSYNYSFFHLVFIMAAFYAAMVISGWEKPFFDPNFQTQEQSVSAWIKIGSSWLGSCLFMFSLVAPLIFTDRDFGY